MGDSDGGRLATLYQQIVAALPPGTTPADFITSLDITARKPPER